MEEIWKAIKEYRGSYEVSNLGRVRSLTREVRVGKRSTRTVKERILLLSLTDNKYLKVLLYREGQYKGFLVHRLVAEAFIPNDENKLTVNHKDCDKVNNKVTNLEWSTHSENSQHAYDNGRYRDRSLEGDCSHHRIGRRSKTSVSKYHYVGWAKSRSKWISCIKHEGKMFKQKYFDSEEECAEQVNSLLDELGDTVRPRNII